MRKYSAIATAIRIAVALLVLVSCAAQPLPSIQQAALAPSLPSATPDTHESVGVSPAPTDAMLNDAGTTHVPTGTTTPNTFVETFDGNPAAPQRWRPTNWEVTVHSRDVDTWSNLEPLRALHGSDCSAPLATHEIRAYEDAVFLCRDHLMTAIKADRYGVIYFTPNLLVDFSTSEAVIRWDMSTLRTSGRDWVDLWITPFADNQGFPLEDWLPALSGPPRNAIHIYMGGQGDDTIWALAS